MKKVLITGCGGFIGGSFAEYYASKGLEVLGVDRLAAPEPALLEDGSAYVRLDISAGSEELKNIIRDFTPDTVLHGAGSASVGASFDSPQEDFQSSVITWANTLEAVRLSGLKPMIIFPSSASVYGNPESLPVSETAKISPISPYGFNKAACELIARQYCECFDLDITVARLFSVYGPRQKRLLVWELFKQASGAESEIVLQGTGDETRDYLHIFDVAESILRIAKAGIKGLNTVNVASGKEISTSELAELVAKAAGKEKPVSTLGLNRSGDPTNWRADVGRTKKLSAYIDRTLEEGITEVIKGWLCE